MVPSRHHVAVLVGLAASAVPDEVMQMYFNFWAPAESWPDAYSASLQPVSVPAQNVIYRYRIDWVEVRTQGAPAAAVPLLPVWSAVVFAALALAALIVVLNRRGSGPSPGPRAG